MIAPVRGLLPEGEIARITESLSGSCTTEIASFDPRFLEVDVAAAGRAERAATRTPNRVRRGARESVGEHPTDGDCRVSQACRRSEEAGRANVRSVRRDCESSSPRAHEREDHHEVHPGRPQKPLCPRFSVVPDAPHRLVRSERLDRFLERNTREASSTPCRRASLPQCSIYGRYNEWCR